MEGSPHFNATQSQRATGGGTYGAEREIAAQQKVFDAAAARGAKLKNPVKLTVTQVQ